MARRQNAQADLPAPGMSRVARPEIEDAAEDLRAITGEIATLNERKRAAKATLLTAMQAAGITVHKYVDPEGEPRQARVKEDPKVMIERDKSSSSSDAPAPDGTIGTGEDVEVS